ncbi:MAG: EscU/YscU/HrcU family type III secretion system export apparatus switch protein [Myxococcales bacterium]|nr:MAG: EscU/YscU/HrcU family type III secretion system export apparatus switch protein [Myxococcales bacterium]
MAESRTHKPTARRIREARRSGDAPRSAVLVSVAASAAVVAVLLWAVWRVPLLFSGLFYAALGRFASSVDHGLGLVDLGLSLAVWCLAPIWLSAVGAVLAVSVAHLGFPVSFSFFRSLSFRRSGMNLFSRNAFVQSLELVIALCLAVLILLWTLYEFRLRISFSPAQNLTDQSNMLAQLFLVFSFRIMLAFSFIALADFAYRRFDFFDRLKMTRTEFLQELKQTEGNPHVLHKQRERHRELVKEDNAEIACVLKDTGSKVVVLSYHSGQVPRLWPSKQMMQANRGLIELIVLGSLFMSRPRLWRA